MVKFPRIYKVFSYTKLLVILLIIMITFIVLSSVYTVKEGEVGILRTFGKVVDVAKPGFHLKFPYPIQQIDVINVSRTNSIEIGFKDVNNPKRNSENTESQVITGDDGLIWIDMIVDWIINDPNAYLFKAKEPETILKNSIIAALKAVTGRFTIDSILADGKINIQNEIKENIDESISKYGLGINILSVKIMDAKPPEEIKSAFEAISDASEQKNTLINKAEEYKNQKLPAAQGEADKIIKEAEAYHEERINKAEAEVAIFNSLYKEYKMSKDVTKTRMLIETLEEILPSANIYIMDAKEGTLNYLPIESFKGEK